ncbi:methyl-accepting chemotaxis protein/methyl-accepting chemotaxis protein-1 (serine sensor receptor) [Rhizobium alvei]
MIATLATATALFTISYQAVEKASLGEMRSIAETTASNIETQMRRTEQLVGDLQSSLASMKATKATDREKADALLQKLLADNSFALGVWTGWDPDAFDGKDKDFVSAKGHDATGRYMPYWVRSGDKVIQEVLVDYTVPGAGDYYIRPHDEGKLVVIEPYVYPVDGKDVLMTSVAMPIKDGDKVVGVAGMDLSLASLSEELAKLKPMGTGEVGLVTASGNIVSHHDRKLEGKSLKDVGEEGQSWNDLMASPGKINKIVDADGIENFAVAVPVMITNDTKWFAVVAVPSETVLASLNSMAWISAGVIVLAAVLLSLIGWLIARRFVGRISGIVDQTTAIANGRMDVVLTDREKADELGDLSRSLGVLLDANRRKMELEQEAEQSRVAQARDQAERLRLANAQEEEIRFAVTELANGLAALSEGNMTVRLDRPFTGALEAIRADFNASVEKLQGAMLSFAENAKVIESGSGEIRSAADDLARRTEQQAASVEETAAALEEITTSVKDSTKRAEDAGKMVARTKNGAEKSGEVVRMAVEAMSAIEQSSQSISNIIGVIDEIAFQTNLLALNAGVEAARAGEAGKGFAVVAQEVRELAQRSANAAKEIKTLITSSGEQVKRGVDLVDETGSALTNIVSEVQEIDRNVQAIVQAAREQSVGLQEINTAVNQMDQATQKNAAMVEETNAASHTLVGEVTSLSNRLAQFNLGGQQSRMASASTSESSRPVSTQSFAPSRPAASTASTFKPKPRVAPAAETARPRPSPAHALTSKLTSAFGASKASDPAPSGDWEEF